VEDPGGEFVGFEDELVEVEDVQFGGSVRVELT